MSRPTAATKFLPEAALGFVISLVAAAVAAAAPQLLPAPVVARLVVAGIGLVCVLRALIRSNEKTGRVVTVALWALVSVAVWAFDAGLPVFVVTQATLIWLARSLFARGRLIEAGLDLAIMTVAVSAGVWAGLRTESVFLAVWCFLLVQATHAFVPATASALLPQRYREPAPADDERAFADACRAADEALRRIASRY